VQALLAWFARNARDLPWRRTRDPYAIWISEIMLQQTQVKTVIAYWQRWMAALPDVQTFAQADSARIHKLWEGLGYYSRVRNAHAAARIIVEEHGGKFPTTFDEVLALPGVGRYTAGAICSIACNLPTPILDGNVIRVVSRVFGVAGDPRAKETNGRLWELAGELVLTAEKIQSGERNCGRLNEALMELGALVCAPVEPRCGLCPLHRQCFARRKGRVGEFPRPKKVAPPVSRRYVAFLAKKNGRFLVRQRPAGAVNAHLWEFPNEEISPSEKRPRTAVKDFVLTNSKPVLRVRHSITRYRILVEAFPAELPATAGSRKAPGVWRTPAQLDRLAFTSAHRKILAAAVQSMPRLGRKINRPE